MNACLTPNVIVSRAETPLPHGAQGEPLCSSSQYKQTSLSFSLTQASAGSDKQILAASQTHPVRGVHQRGPPWHCRIPALGTPLWPP